MSPVAVACASADSAPAVGVEAAPEVELAEAGPVEVAEPVETDADPGDVEGPEELVEDPQPAAPSVTIPATATATATQSF